MDPKEEAQKKKKKNEKRVQLASNNVQFSKSNRNFWDPYENGKQRFFILLDLL